MKMTSKMKKMKQKYSFQQIYSLSLIRENSSLLKLVLAWHNSAPACYSIFDNMWQIPITISTLPQPSPITAFLPSRVETSRGVCYTILLLLTLSSTGIVRLMMLLNMRIMWRMTVITSALHKTFHHKQRIVLPCPAHLHHNYHLHQDPQLFPTGDPSQCPPDGGGMISCTLRMMLMKKVIMKSVQVLT